MLHMRQVKKLLLLVVGSSPRAVGGAPQQRVSVDASSHVVSLELRAGDEFVAARRSIVGCYPHYSEEDDTPPLLRVSDPTLERLGLKLGPWARVMPAWLSTTVARWRRRRRGESPPLSRFAAARRVDVHLAAARPGWGACLVKLGANESFVAKAGAIACCYDTALSTPPSSARHQQLAGTSSHPSAGADAQLLRCRGGTVALAAPGAVLKTTLKAGGGDVDDRRLLAWSSSSPDDAPRLASYAGAKWRSFPPAATLYTAAALQDPGTVVVVQRPAPLRGGKHSSSSSQRGVLVPGRHSGLLRSALRGVLTPALTAFVFLAAVALLRCNFDLARFVRSFVVTTSDARFFLHKLFQTISLIYVDVRTAITDDGNNDAWGPLDDASSSGSMMH